MYRPTHSLTSDKIPKNARNEQRHSGEPSVAPGAMTTTSLPRLHSLPYSSSSTAKIPLPLLRRALPGFPNANTKLSVPLPSIGRSRRLSAGARGFGVAVPEKGRKEEDDGGGNKRGGDDDDEEIPQVVFDRMVRRILVAVGMPMAGGVGLLYVMSVLKENGIWDVPVWLPFASTLLSFGTSALGIAYGTLSTSWDPDREGSVFGWAEVTKNWPKLWEEEREERR